MEILYYPNNKTDKSINYTILNLKNEEIGSVEGYLNDVGSFFSVVKIKEEYQRLGLGFTAFEKVFNEINSKYEILKITGSWHKDDEFSYCDSGMSTNLKIFLECCLGKNERDCCFETPTGKWARKLNFNNLEIVRKSKNEVLVEFTK